MGLSKSKDDGATEGLNANSSPNATNSTIIDVVGGPIIPDTAPLGSTLEEVVKRGSVRCGVYLDMPGFSFQAANGTMSGFNYELVRHSSHSSGLHFWHI